MREGEETPWETVVAELAGELDAPGLRLDAEGRAAMVVDGSLTVELAALPHGLAAVARLGEIADFAREEVFAAMLAANLPGGGLAGASLGYDGGEAALSLYFPPGADARRVAECLAGFVETAEAWRKRLNG